MRGYPSGADGYAGSLSCTREVSAVTAACMMIRRELFSEAGGFDERFATHYQDLDLCSEVTPLRSAQSLHAARDRAPRRERDPRLSVRPPRSRSSPRRVGRHDRARRSLLQPLAFTRGGRLPTAGSGMNVLFVNYHDFTANSAVHICNLAAELVESGVGCAVAVPGDPATVELLGEQPFQTLDFDGARNGALRFPDGGPLTLRARLDATRSRPPADAGAERAPFLPLRRSSRGQRGRDHRRPARPDGRGAACGAGRVRPGESLSSGPDAAVPQGRGRGPDGDHRPPARRPPGPTVSPPRSSGRPTSGSCSPTSRASRSSGGGSGSRTERR